MGEKIKILILMGMTMSLMACGVVDKNVRGNNITITTSIENKNEIIEKVEGSEEDIIEENKEFEAIDLEPTININYSYEVIGDKSICSDILFTEKYTDLEGIVTFRGNNFRNTASYGISKISQKELNVKWKTSTSFRSVINVGNPIKGSLSIDSRGIPMLYVGEGINESGVTGFNIYSLIDGSSLYEINGYDEYAYRGWPAFDSSALIYSDGDIVIEGGENGILYITKLNTDYDKYTNTVSVNPEILKYRYYTGEGYGRLGIENSVAAYANLLYFADNNGDIQCIDLRKMEPIWVIEGLDDIDASITIEAEEGVPYLYVGDEVDHQGISGISTIRKINGLTGEVVWKNEFSCQSVVGTDATNGGVLATNVIGKNNISDSVIFSLARYDGFNSGAIISINKSTGEIQWETKVDNYLWSSPVDFYDKNGNAYIIQCDSIGNMFLIDGKNGEILNSLTLDANIEASPAIYEDTIVIATRAGSIYGIEIK